MNLWQVAVSVDVKAVKKTKQKNPTKPENYPKKTKPKKPHLFGSMQSNYYNIFNANF